MDAKTRTLVDAIIGAGTTVGMALVTFFHPDNAVALNGVIGAIDTAIVFILNIFTKKDKKEV